MIATPPCARCSYCGAFLTKIAGESLYDRRGHCIYFPFLFSRPSGSLPGGVAGTTSDRCLQHVTKCLHPGILFEIESDANPALFRAGDGYSDCRNRSTTHRKLCWRQLHPTINSPWGVSPQNSADPRTVFPSVASYIVERLTRSCLECMGSVFPKPLR